MLLRFPSHCMKPKGDSELAGERGESSMVAKLTTTLRDRVGVLRGCCILGGDFACRKWDTDAALAAASS